MSVLICKLTGSRGRRIAVYDNKCVITTDVSLGSLLTSNALDGQKTIFYIDVQGIQFKKSGFTIGYLQLETASIQMNNQNSNMFSENTFTFEDTSNGIPNALMEKIHDYIVDRIESYKYGTPAQNKYLYELVSAAEKTSVCHVDYTITTQVKNEMQEQLQQREQERAEKQRLAQEAQRQAVEGLRRSIQSEESATQIDLFLSQASTCTRIVEIHNLWKSFTWEEPLASTIGKKIGEAAQIERMYGSSPSSLNRLIADLRKMI